MSLKVVAFVVAALAGIALAAGAAANGAWPLQLVGLALIIGCIYVGWTWIAAQSKPPAIKPAANPAWSMREQPPPSKQSEAPAPGPSPTDVGEGRH
jgi:hypothetical protein